jgi:hypothetical protein
MILSNIKQLFVRNKKIFFYLWFFVIIYLLSTEFSFATDIEDTEKEFNNKIAVSVQLLLKLVSVWLAVITFLATMFLSPDWINGSIFWLTAEFKKVWILVSNLVYVVFAFLLIWIAFMNIIWKNDNQYQLKQALPKFIVWVLIVPFSWFAVHFILSISAILTVSVMTLPFDSLPVSVKGEIMAVTLPKWCNIDMKASWDESFIECEVNPSITIWDTQASWVKVPETIFWIIAVYTYSLISFEDIWKIDLTDLNSISNLWDLIVKILFDFIFVIVYWILMITLWIVLMVRWIYIWIFMMISPIFWLMYFFDKKEWSWFFEKFNFKEFIALAMVPVYTMLALSFWILFMYTIWKWITDINWSGIVRIDDCTQWGPTVKCIIVNDFELGIEWAVSKVWSNTSSFLNKVWATSLWIIWALIIKLLGIVILWSSILAAMWSSKITWAITKPIQDFWTKVWWIVSSWAWNIPIFWWQSMNSLNTAAGRVQTSINSYSTEKWWKFAENFIKEKPNTKKIYDAVKWVSKDSDVWLKEESITKLLKLLPQVKNETDRKLIVDSLEKNIWFEWLDRSKFKDTSDEWVKNIARYLDSKDENVKNRWDYKTYNAYYKALSNWKNIDSATDPLSKTTWTTWTSQPTKEPKVDVRDNINRSKSYDWTDQTVNPTEIKWIANEIFAQLNLQKWLWKISDDKLMTILAAQWLNKDNSKSVIDILNKIPEVRKAKADNAGFVFDNEVKNDKTSTTTTITNNNTINNNWWGLWNKKDQNRLVNKMASAMQGFENSKNLKPGENGINNSDLVNNDISASNDQINETPS